MVLGSFAGLVIGGRAAHMASRGASVVEISKAVRTLSPAATAVGGTILIVTLSAPVGEFSFSLGSWVFDGIVYVIAVAASWHAGHLIANKALLDLL